MSVITVVISVDSCTPAFVAAVKQSALFAETCRHPEGGRRRGKEKEVIRLIRSQGTIGMILKLIFQGLKKKTYIQLFLYKLYASGDSVRAPCQFNRISTI